MIYTVHLLIKFCVSYLKRFLKSDILDTGKIGHFDFQTGIFGSQEIHKKSTEFKIFRFFEKREYMTHFYIYEERFKRGQTNGMNRGHFGMKGRVSYF